MHELTLDMRSRIDVHLASFSQRLRNTSACDHRSCSLWWKDQERVWRRQVEHAERVRLLMHALDTGKFMPEIRQPIFKGFRPAMWRTFEAAPLAFSTQPLTAFTPEYSCAATAWRVDAGDDATALRKSGGDSTGTGVAVDDGHKYLCGRHIASPCTMLSVGSNFQDGFERALSAAAKCRAYVVDPTLGAESSTAVIAFAKRLESYGARLNASVGLGASGTELRVGSGPTGARRPLLALGHVLKGASWLGCDGPRCHLSVMKLDCEGCEFEALTNPSWGAWALCESGYLTIDELVVEVHAAKRAASLADLHAVFAGALACGLMLHQKEVNWAGCKRGNCAEFSWVNVRHAARIARRGATGAK